MAQNLRQLQRIFFQSVVHFSPTKSSISYLNRDFVLKSRIQEYSKFTSTASTNLSVGTTLNSDSAYELVLNLSDSERNALKDALDKLQSNAVKQKLEGELAATRWRTKFSRPSSSKLGQVDPTGAYCAMPEDWLRRKAEENAKRPETRDLWKLFFVNAVPFLGFGFLDNFIMICAGDSIDHLFGTVFCFSTMAAAGFGNTISDVIGIGSAHYIERGCEIMGLRPPKLSTIQMEMKSSRKYASWGRIIGITVGCIVGMCPLLFTGKKDSPAESEAGTEPAPSSS